MIGDVCGKGVPAAAMTALIRHTLREAAVLQATPAEALTALNAVLQRHESDRFCTVSFLRLQRRDDTWHGLLGLAGHPPAMLRTADGALRRTGRSGSLLGVLDQVHLEDVPVALEPGDILLLYTDGLTEARTAGRDGRFGSNALLDFAGGLAPATAGRVVDALTGLVSTLPYGLDDDVAFMAMRVSG